MSNLPQQPPTDNQPEASISTGKRSLLKYGWTAPLIVAVSLPKSGFAANISGKHDDPGRGKPKPKPRGRY